MSATRMGQQPAPSQFREMLLSEGLLTQEQASNLLQACQTTNASFVELVWQQGMMDEDTLAKALSRFYRIKYITPAELQPQQELKKVLPEVFMAKHKVFPLLLDELEKRLEVLMMEPDQVQVLDEITRLTGFRVIPRLTTPSCLASLLATLGAYRIATNDTFTRADEGLSQHDVSITPKTGLEKEMAEDEAPIVQLVNAILAEAVKHKASDVHFESHKEGLIVRFRIDGILRDVKTVPKQHAAAVISRIKITSGMDISERRRPQDGRIRFNTDNLDIDIRVNTIAVKYGESVVLRLLHANNGNLGLENLSLTQPELKQLMRIIQSPNGIILVTGPTGSGKTSTLYSALREINSRERKIITIEDPIEYPLPGLNQTQISTKAGLTFANSLKAIMRQDPDVIMVGEIRDQETLDASMHAALTGHLVFSTLHTNSAVKTITRLKEMGAAPYLISSAIVCIIAQRLVRRICENCKTGYQANPEELKILGFQNAKQSITLYKGTGCSQCEYTGYKGRMALFEIMEMSREIQELVEASTSPGQILDVAIQNGMTTLGMDGERKISAGLTTVEEVTRVLGVGW